MQNLTIEQLLTATAIVKHNPNELFEYYTNFIEINGYLFYFNNTDAGFIFEYGNAIYYIPDANFITICKNLKAEYEII